MTDSFPTPDDELVSAVLDGEATPAERAAVAADPRLSARLEELRAVALAVGTPPAPPADRHREAAVAAALAAAAEPVAPVVDLDAVRRRRRWQLLVGAAAALGVLAGLAALASRPSPRSSETASVQETAATTSARREDSAGDALTDTPDGERDEGGSDGARAGDDVTEDADAVDDVPSSVPAPPVADTAPSAVAGTTELDLGSFATREEARLAVSEAIDRALAGPSGNADPQASGPGCDPVLRAEDPELAALLFAASYDIAGDPHQVLAYRLVQTGAQNGTHRVVEVEPTSCRILGRQTV